ncbi:hypothetical protein F0562_010024 [Nyssa sinensis]|uniref:Uncharacterized protein n=1 Tax=Nyssa sinensis TaxID=561372 RepID=A0A5J5A2E7_9ASTE|nr:hypothetical protein F0562_010024 [Nyssa sinensis]
MTSDHVDWALFNDSFLYNYRRCWKILLPSDDLSPNINGIHHCLQIHAVVIACRQVMFMLTHSVLTLHQILYGVVLLASLL